MNEALIENAVRRLESQEGFTEGACSSSVGNNTPYGKWYGMNCAAWCAMFLSWGFFLEDLPLPASTEKGFAFTPSGAAWFQQKKAWSPASAEPKRGWIPFFFSSSAGRIAHVGTVRGSRGSDGLIPTVEGNTDTAGSASGGRVLFKRRSTSQSLGFRVAGYGRPDLLEVDLSAADVKAINEHTTDMMRAGVRYLGQGNPDVAFEGDTIKKTRAEVAELKVLLTGQADDETKILAAIAAARVNPEVLVTGIVTKLRDGGVLVANVDEAKLTAAVENAVKSGLGGLVLKAQTP